MLNPVFCKCDIYEWPPYLSQIYLPHALHNKQFKVLEFPSLHLETSVPCWVPFHDFPIIFIMVITFITKFNFSLRIIFGNRIDPLLSLQWFLFSWQKVAEKSLSKYFRLVSPLNCIKFSEPKFYSELEILQSSPIYFTTRC